MLQRYDFLRMMQRRGFLLYGSSFVLSFLNCFQFFAGFFHFCFAGMIGDRYAIIWSDRLPLFCGRNPMGHALNTSKCSLITGGIKRYNDFCIRYGTVFFNYEFDQYCAGNPFCFSFQGERKKAAMLPPLLGCLLLFLANGRRRKCLPREEVRCERRSRFFLVALAVDRSTSPSCFQ